MQNRTPVDVPTQVPNIIKFVPLIFGGILLLFMLKGAFIIVEPGMTGVKATLGKVNQTPLPEGLHFCVPGMDQVTQIDIRQRKESAEATAASKDLQTVSAKIDVQYSLVGGMVPQIYQKIGPREVFAKTIIDPCLLYTSPSPRDA